MAVAGTVIGVVLGIAVLLAALAWRAHKVSGAKATPPPLPQPDTRPRGADA